MPLDANALRPRIRAILASADLETVSAKQVRKRLCAEKPRLDEDDVKAAKAEIDEVIAELFDELRDSADAPSASPPSTSKTASRPAYSASPSGPPPSSLPQPLATSSKREKTKKPKTKREPDSDAMLAQRLSDELNAHTTRGGRSADRVGSSSTGGKKAKKASAARKFKSEDTVVDSDDAAPTGKSKRRAASSDDDDSDDDDDERPRAKKAAKTSSGQPRGGAFNKEMALSPALSQLMAGETQLSRPQTVKRLWEYVKARDLQDPADKRYIVCEGDPLLTAVFQTPRVHMFTLNKILSKHLFPIED